MPTAADVPEPPRTPLNHPRQRRDHVAAAGITGWDARMSVKRTNQVSAVLLVDSLADRDYSERPGCQPLRRAILAGVRVGF